MMARRTPVGAGIAAMALIAGCHSPQMPSDHAPPMSACMQVTLNTSTRFSAETFDSELPAAGQWRDGFDLADMDGDGFVDLLHGPQRKGKALPTIFLSDGKGHFQPWGEAHFPPLAYDYGDAKAGDFNGDGRMDIALAVHLRGMVTMISEGDGHYAPWGEGLGLTVPGQQSGEAVFSSRRIEVVDWDQDGKPDLLAANEGPALYIPGSESADALALFLNRHGYWERFAATHAARSFGNALAIGDVDGDGHMDAMLGTEVAGTRKLLQMGKSTTFEPRELYSLPANAEITAVALHDFDRDGHADVIDAARAVDDGHYCTALQAVFMSADSGERPLALWSEVSRDPVAAIAIGDIDGDGQDDLVAVREAGGILMFAGSGDGFTRDTTIEPLPEMAGCSAYSARLADLDGDHSLELLVSYAGEGSPTGERTCVSHGGFHTWHLRHQ